jgi:FHS family glucose/mannose:H+ symporter-like MFS transporter
VFAHLDFVLTGMVMTLLGPILPVLSTRWALNDMQAGYLFFAQFASSCAGMLLSGMMVRRYGYRLTLMFGLATSGIGVALLARADWTFGLLAVCIFGVAFGTNTPATNLFVARTYAPKSASALNLLNSSWGVGAMACPLLMAVAQRTDRVPLFLYGLSGGLIVLVVAMSLVAFRVDVEKTPITQISPNAGSPWQHRLLPIIMVLFFVYVGSENSVGGWVASYARRIGTSSSSTFWTITPSFFWGALLLGRALAPLALRKAHETMVAGCGVALASIGIAILLMAKTMTPVVVGASLAGLGFSSVYPINVSLLSRWFGEATTRLSGIIFAIGNLGAAVMPLVVGAVSKKASLRAGLTVPLCGALGMLVFYLAHRNAHSSPIVSE